MLELSHVNMNFGGVVAVNDVSFNIPLESLTGIIGPNGAGKTTIFNIISGVYTPSSGKIIFKGEDITSYKAHKINKMGIARTFQNLRLFARSTVLENIITAAQNKFSSYDLIEAILHLGRWSTVESDLKNFGMDLLERVGLADRADQEAGTLPYGLQRKLEIARALATKPELLLLDEPAAGMNPEEVNDLNNLILQIHKDFKLTILVIEHHMDMIMKICPHVICLNFGAKIAEGTGDEIQNNSEVLEAYLGHSK